MTRTATGQAENMPTHYTSYLLKKPLFTVVVTTKGVISEGQTT